MTVGGGGAPAKFLAVGAAGFAVDAGLLTVLAQAAGWNVYAARAVSFACAVSVTYLLNRRWAFRRTAAPAIHGTEYARYLTVQVIAAFLNLAIFVVLVAALPALRALPVVPLAAGAAFGLALNYAGARMWVFRPGQRT
jgi:putative flippase GtrA